MRIAAAERRAYICLNADGSIHRRVFLLADEQIPRCATHGRMRKQRDQPYRGTRPLPPPEAA